MRLRGFKAMPQTQTLNQNSDFRRIYKKGKSRVSPLLVTYAMKNRLAKVRVGFVSSKKIGKAVFRNRARRVLRAAYRQCGIQVPPGWDVVFVCRTKTAFVKSTAVEPVMRRHLSELLPGGGKEPS